MFDETSWLTWYHTKVAMDTLEPYEELAAEIEERFVVQDIRKKQQIYWPVCPCCQKGPPRGYHPLRSWKTYRRRPYSPRSS